MGRKSLDGSVNTMVNPSNGNEVNMAILIEGWLMKKCRFPKPKVLWNDRYFVLQGNMLSYYLQRGDLKAKGAYELNSSCVVSSIKTIDKRDDSSKLRRENKNKKVRYHLKIFWPDAITKDEDMNNS